jgi:hypothetical protein
MSSRSASSNSASSKALKLDASSKLTAALARGCSLSASGSTVCTLVAGIPGLIHASVCGSCSVRVLSVAVDVARDKARCLHADCSEGSWAKRCTCPHDTQCACKLSGHVNRQRHDEQSFAVWARVCSVGRTHVQPLHKNLRCMYTRVRVQGSIAGGSGVSRP